jgi:oligopeptide transport system substrate-binding protein
MIKKPLVLAACALLLLGVSGCGGARETRVESGIRDKILHLGNGDEVQDLDPQTVTGVPEHNILSALFEGLVAEDPKDLSPVPGVAERWEISPDQLVYTFHLRANARWSNGDPVVASDFIQSYQRMLTPALGADYANMLFPIRNAEQFYRGEINDFSEVGLRALDDRTLEMTLKAPTPYFLSMLGHHYSTWPVHIPTIAKHDGLARKGSRWTRPENMVSNGPFVLAEWRVNEVIRVKKNPHYWDAENVKLNEIHFYPIQSKDTEERAFRSGQLHVTYELIPQKIAWYQERQPHLLRIDPYLGTYFYRFNVTHPILKDKRIRHALALSIDRESLVRNVMRAGQVPAYHFTPPNTGGYTAQARFEGNVERARQLLAEAGYPEGKGLPSLEILFNTHESHRAVAEAIQQMWRHNLGVNITLVNTEWKVFLDKQDTMDYQISRAGWIGDYVDPNTFLEMWKTGNGNNDTGWSHPEYDRLIDQASITADPQERFALFQRAEAILLDELPIMPIFFYTRPYNIHPSVQGWHPTLFDHHPYKHVDLVPVPAS